MSRRTTVTDEIYQAAIETAGHLGSPVEVSAAIRALAYELELRGLDVTFSSADADEKPGAKSMLVDGSDGVFVTAAAEPLRDSELGEILRRNEWEQAHEILFAPGSLHIKSVAK